MRKYTLNGSRLFVGLWSNTKSNRDFIRNKSSHRAESRVREQCFSYSSLPLGIRVLEKIRKVYKGFPDCLLRIFLDVVLLWLHSRAGAGAKHLTFLCHLFSGSLTFGIKSRVVSSRETRILRGMFKNKKAK